MPKLPIISGEHLVKILVSKGYSVRSQRGSHINLTKPGSVPITVPLHKELKRGLLLHIMRQTGISRSDLVPG